MVAKLSYRCRCEAASHHGILWSASCHDSSNVTFFLLFQVGRTAAQCRPAAAALRLLCESRTPRLVTGVSTWLSTPPTRLPAPPITRTCRHPPSLGFPLSGTVSRSHLNYFTKNVNWCKIMTALCTALKKSLFFFLEFMGVELVTSHIRLRVVISWPDTLSNPAIVLVLCFMYYLHSTSYTPSFAIYGSRSLALHLPTKNTMP